MILKVLKLKSSNHYVGFVVRIFISIYKLIRQVRLLNRWIHYRFLNFNATPKLSTFNIWNVENAGTTEEVKALFEKEASNVWGVFLDTFQHFEQGKASTKEMKGIN